MDENTISERNRRQLDKLSRDPRAKAEAVVTRTQSPESRANEAVVRSELDREFRETGRIAALGDSLSETVRTLSRIFSRHFAARGSRGG